MIEVIDMEDKESIRKLPILAARQSLDGETSIRIHDFKAGEEIDSIDYVTVSYQDEVRNLLLHYTRFTKEECPYNQVPQSTPYIVIKDDVYELASFATLSYKDKDII